MDPIRTFFAALMRALRSSTGTHPASVGVVPMPAHRPDARPSVRTVGPVLRGEEIGHVRPYLVAFERQQEAQRQRERRWALLLAVHGIDVGPRVIHGVQVAR